MQIGWHMKALEVVVVQLDSEHFEWEIKTAKHVDGNTLKTVTTKGSGDRWALLAVFRAAVEQAELYLKEESQ